MCWEFFKYQIIKSASKFQQEQEQYSNFPLSTSASNHPPHILHRSHQPQPHVTRQPPTLYQHSICPAQLQLAIWWVKASNKRISLTIPS